MKHSLTLMAYFCCVTYCYSQEYIISEQKTSPSHHELIANQSTIYFDENNETLNEWIKMPFEWTFYGEQVEGFRISEYGYITFSEDEMTNQPLNTDLPNPSSPKNAIYCFWDDFTAFSLVHINEKGIAPNRILEIDWQGLSKEGDEGHMRIILKIQEKTQDFKIHIRHNSFDYESISGTIGMQNASGTEGTQFSVNESHDLNGFYLLCSRYDAPLHDAALVQVNQYTQLKAGQYPMSCVIKNQGIEIIESIKIGYSINNGPTKIKSFDDLYILSGHDKRLFLNDVYTIESGGQELNICYHIHSVNGTEDQRSWNDEFCEFTVGMNGNGPYANVIIEEMASATCGFCPPSNAIINSYHEQYPDRIYPVVIHFNDEMQGSVSIDSCYGVNGIPSSFINRTNGDYRIESVQVMEYDALISGWLSDRTAQHISLQSLDFDPITRDVEATLKVSYEDYGIGENSNLLLMIVEDSLIGSGYGWDQTNSYNEEEGHEFEGAGSPIKDYVHRHVLREYVESDAYGIPVADKPVYNPGEFYKKTYYFNLSESYTIEQVYLVAAVVKNTFDQSNDPGTPGVYGNKYILAGNRFALKNIVSTTNSAQAEQEIFTSYPNPVHLTLNIQSKIPLVSTCELTVFSSLGQIVYKGEISAQQHHIDVSNFSKGLYYWTIQYDGLQYQGDFVKF